MNIKRKIILLLTIVLFSCNPTTNSPASISSTNTHLLFVVEGEVKIKRSAWADGFHEISSGAFLSHGDMLLPSPDARIIVLCDDLFIWLVPSGIESGVNNGCNDSKEAVISRPNGDIGNTRGIVDPTTPYIINPRASKILNDQPVLKWNSVLGTKNYKVQIEHDGQVFWETETPKNQIHYPGDPALKPGISYILIVSSDKGKSSKYETAIGPLSEAAIDLSFQLVDTPEAQEIEDLEEKILSLDLSVSNKEYTTSILYSSKGFYSESILLLEKVVMTDSDNLYALLQLGKYQLSIGLPFLAKTNFESVVDRANYINDIELNAMSLEALSTSYLNIGDREKAIEKLQEAEFVFKSLGDVLHAQELHELRLKITP